LEALSRELNIADRVKWLGWQKDMTSFYQSLDLLLFNSDWDAMGMTPLEAVSYGVPLVASVLHGGLKEILDRDEYGLVLSEHDIEQLAEKAVGFLQDPPGARRAALAARERVIQVSDTKRLAEKVEWLLLRGAA
jgi:glycosyltransferase involved in cell wall biosynthesis